MASHAPDFGRASALPLSAVLASIPSYPRPVIERLVSRLIDHLDEADGDPDLEESEPLEDEEHAASCVTELIVPPCHGGHHIDTGRGVCADCGTFLPTSERRAWQ